MMIELSDHLVAGTSDKPLDPNAYGNTTPLHLLPFQAPRRTLFEYGRTLGDQRRGKPGRRSRLAPRQRRG